MEREQQAREAKKQAELEASVRKQSREATSKKLDLSWVKPGVQIMDTRYGRGIIISVGRDIIKIRYGRSEKFFTYPGTIEKGFISKIAPQTEPSKPSAPEWAVIGATVKHRSFGKGVITAMDSDYVSVSFQNADKKFLNPKAFLDGHLQEEEDTTANKSDAHASNSNKRSEFLTYLKQKGYAESSAAAIASAVSRAGTFAIEKGFSDISFFEIQDLNSISRIWGRLEQNDDFIQFNWNQNRRFSIAMNHYIDFITMISKR